MADDLLIRLDNADYYNKIYAAATEASVCKRADEPATATGRDILSHRSRSCLAMIFKCWFFSTSHFKKTRQHIILLFAIFAGCVSTLPFLS